MGDNYSYNGKILLFLLIEKLSQYPELKNSLSILIKQVRIIID